MASLSCRISIRNGVAEVFNEDGTPSELYAEALKETGNQEEALNLWAIAYSQDFVAESPITGDSARLNDVIKFLDTKDSQRKTLTKEQRLEIKGMMKENNLASLAELQRTLVKVFKPLGIPTFEPGMEADKLYSPTEQQEVDPEAVSEVMVAIEGELRRGNIIVNPENKSGKSLSDTTKKTPLGTSENISSEQVEQDIIDSIENFQDREEVERIVDNHENYDALDRPASFKYYLARLRRLPIMTFNGVTATEENRRTYNEIITNALPSALAAIRADLFTINKISDNVWNSKKAATKKIISALEKELALHGIDIVGLSKAEVSRPDLVGMLTALQTHLEEGDDVAVERFAEIKDKYITPKPATRVTLVDPAYEGLDVVYSENSYPDSYLFEQEGLIRIGENLYHRVNREDNTISNYAEALYQKVLDGVFAVPTEVDDIQDPNNKEELLKDIINFAAGRNTGLQVNDNVEVSLAQMYFEHNPIVKRDVIGELGHISTDVDYLKDDFISDFYKYVLKEKIKNSYAYRTILSKFSFSEAGISLDYPISTIEDIEYQKELEDYIRLKKDSSMNYLLPSSIPAVTQELKDLNDINSVPSFVDQVQRYKEYVVTPSATSNIIKVDGKLYRNIGNGNNMSVFAEVVTPTSVYFDTEGTTEHDQDVVNSIIEKQMFIFAPEKLTTEEFQQKQKENKINTKAPKVDKEALQDEKTAKALAIKLQGLDDTPTETAQEYVKSKRLGNNPQLVERVDSLLNKSTTKLVSEYLKQKLGMGISILSNSDMRTELAKRGYDSLKAMVQAYHGSPFSFDKFTTSKMGTGEGNQAFGWGLYFTDLESIAKDYAKNTSIVINGKPIQDFNFKILDKILKYNTSIWVGTTKESFEKEMENEPLQDIEREELKDDLLKVNTLSVNADNIIYKVSLHKGKTPDQYTWLEWDKPVTKELKDKVRVALNELGINTNSIGYASTTWVDGKPVKTVEPGKDLIGGLETGKDLYEAIGIRFNGNLNEVQKKASLLLLDLGIDGVKYPAESISRGATSDSARGFNYVVFDENAVTIDEKVQFLSANDKVYGFYDGSTGEIYLTEDFLNSGALIHEHFHLFKPILKEQATKGNKDAKLLLSTLTKIVDESGAFNEAEFSARYDSSAKDAAGNPVQFSAENVAYHGGDLSMGIDGPLFVSEDRNQAEAYAEGNNGSIQKFNLNDLNIANEEDLIKILKDNEFTPAEGWTFDELNIHEILDPIFSDTSLSKPELDRLYEILSLKGIDAVRFTDSNLQTLKQDINNIVVFNTDKLSNVKMSTTLSSEVYNPRPGESKEDYLERMREEVEANLLGDNSTEYFQRIAEENNFTEAQTKTFLQRIKSFIGKFSKWIADQLGFKNITPEQAAAMTTKEALDRITTSMLRGDFVALDIKNGIDMFSILEDEQVTLPSVEVADIQQKVNEEHTNSVAFMNSVGFKLLIKTDIKKIDNC